MSSKHHAVYLFCFSLLWIPSGRGTAQTFATLYNFDGTNYSAGTVPSGAMVVSASGVLCGVTTRGGAYNKSTCGVSGCGTVFSLTPPASPGAAWTETVLWSFGSAPGDGTNPQGQLVISNGVLFGTTSAGGANNSGTVYSLTPPASPGGAWTETVLWSFGSSPADGTNPQAGLAIDAKGLLYGTTGRGGSNGAGVIFSLTPPASPGASWEETILSSPKADFGEPTALVIGRKGVLYGAMSEVAGKHGGSIFSVTPPASSGKSWLLRTLWTFPRSVHGRSPDGEQPNGPLVLERKTGNLYGSTPVGGSSQNGGTIFRLSAPTTTGGQWTFKTLHVFQGADGLFPTALVQSAGSTLYGTTQVGVTPTTAELYFRSFLNDADEVSTRSRLTGVTAPPPWTAHPGTCRRPR